MYDGAASRWRRSLQRPRAYADLFAGLHALGLLQSLMNGGRVLDCGIGAGDLSLALASTTVPSVQIEGVDISAGMLDEAQRGLALAQVKAQCQQGDVREFTFADGSFDLVMSAQRALGSWRAQSPWSIPACLSDAKFSPLIQIRSTAPAVHPTEANRVALVTDAGRRQPGAGRRDRRCHVWEGHLPVDG